MNKQMKSEFLAQIDDMLHEYSRIAGSDKDEPETRSLRFKLITQALAISERSTGTDSAYTRQINSILDGMKGFEDEKLDRIAGVMRCIHGDIKRDALSSMAELIHGELFGDFLEMADHLCNEGYKDAAAVIAGSSLEAHLRQLCNRSNIDTTYIARDQTVQPKKADSMNADLASKSVYRKLDQKSVTAWLDLRNKAAHGEYDKYERAQVALMISAIRDFITRNPA